MRRGTLGTENLNAVIQKTIHPKGTPGLKQFFVKDRVMQIANNYDKGIFNGEIGYVESIDEHDQYLSVRFDSRTIEYAYTELDQLMLSYSITVHRCIGSQSQCVIAVFHGHQQSCRMLRRDILYTAVTRTRDLLIIIGTRKALEMAVKNGETQQRFSGLFDHS
jgi:exodeoxyribonuclease V alpha subunit